MTEKEFYKHTEEKKIATLGEEGEVIVMKVGNDYLLLDQNRSNRFETDNFGSLMNFNNKNFSLRSLIETLDGEIIIK